MIFQVGHEHCLNHHRKFWSVVLIHDVNVIELTPEDYRTYGLMLPNPNFNMSFTLRVTLHKTTKPVVSRLLSIPDDLTFEELHQTIEAAFDWADPADPCTSWKFLLCNRDPLKISNPEIQDGTLSAYYTHPNRGYGIQPALLHTTTPINEFFAPANMGYSKYWSYSYNIARFHHAIEIVQASGRRPHVRGKIECIEQTGMIGYKVWQFGDMRRVRDVERQTLSSSWVDEGTHERLERVQEVYQSRKQDEERPFKRCKVSVPREMKQEDSVVDRDERDLFLPSRSQGYGEGSHDKNAQGVQDPERSGGFMAWYQMFGGSSDNDKNTRSVEKPRNNLKQNNRITSSNKRSYDRMSRGVEKPRYSTRMPQLPPSSDEESCDGDTINL